MNTTLELSTVEVAERARVSYRQLDYWARLGVISGQGVGFGSGSRRVWTRGQLRVVSVLGRYTALFGQGTVADLTSLARIVEAHDDGFAVRYGTGAWEWCSGMLMGAEVSVFVQLG